MVWATVIVQTGQKKIEGIDAKYRPGQGGPIRILEALKIKRKQPRGACIGDTPWGRRGVASYGKKITLGARGAQVRASIARD